MNESGLLSFSVDGQLLELPDADCLYGLRVHSWVLVLAGKRDVAENFFIEPLTGLPHPVNSANYLGIESVWNHRNYWVNMQDCSEGVTVCLSVCLSVLSTVTLSISVNVNQNILVWLTYQELL